MMKITLVAVGKLKEAYLRDACAEYAKRLSRFCKLEIVELPERSGPSAEAEEILRRVKGYCYALALEGEEKTSEAFAQDLRGHLDAGRELTFVVGSSCGLDKEVKRRADALLSFSKMTFPHQLFRVMLLEQLYRAFMIVSGSEYHK